MKKIIILTAAVLLGFAVQAQVEGRVIYNETFKISIEGLDESMKDMIPSSQTTKKELLFQDQRSIYQNQKGEVVDDVNLSSDDGSFQIKFIKDKIENILYKDLESKQMLHQKGMMGKPFLVDGQLPSRKWKITSEKIKYLGYVCQKAIIEDENQFVVAWFTSEIPVQHGPADFQGLPGAILMISIDDGKTEIKAVEIDLKKIDSEAISKPTEGKKVTEEKFQSIQDEKLKEMEEMYGSDKVKIRN